MASESVELPVIPDVTKSPVIEKRRHSAGKTSSGKSNGKIVPHYLRASTGSCHDFCKYGKEHAFASKERRSIPNRATRKQLHQSSQESVGRVIAKSKISADSKPTSKMSTAVLEESVDSKPTKMPTVVLKESVDSKTGISDALDANSHKLPSKSVVKEKHIVNEVKVNRKKTPVVDKPPSLLSKSHASPSTSQEFSSSTDKEVRSLSKSTSTKVETPLKSTPKKVKTPSKSTPAKMETLSKWIPKKVENTSKSTTEVITSSKSIAGEVEAVSKPTLKKVENPSRSTSKAKTTKTTGTSLQLPSLNVKEMKLSAKHSISLNSNRVARKKVSSSMSSSEGFEDKRNSEIKMEKKVSPSKTAPKKLISPIKALSSPRASLKRVSSLNSRKNKSLKIVSHLRNQNTARKVELDEHNNNEVEEKTLYVVNMESENNTLQSDQTASYDDDSYLPQLSTPISSSTSITQSLSEEDQEESEYTTSEFEVDSLSASCEIECMENEETLEDEKKGKPRKVKDVEDKDCEMMKLKFRRGKVIDNQIEKNTPRKLKFRRAKMLPEKANVEDDGGRKSYRKRDETSSESNIASQEKVVLRHQDIEDKKDAQGLLNNVIEETASKLVEARKSKVKALVGAFETVISLQEKKPSAANSVS